VRPAYVQLPTTPGCGDFLPVLPVGLVVEFPARGQGRGDRPAWLALAPHVVGVPETAVE
jgi:hypothetical protein